MSSLAKLYRLKEDPAPPQRYLGANILRHQLVDGRVVWAMSSYDYVKNAVRIVEDLLDKDGERGLSPRGMKVPWSNDYRPELDISRLLTGDMITRFQNLIGILQWMVELGRVDILHEVAKLSSFNAQPREGHLEAVYKIFAYLKGHEKSRMVFDDYDIVPDANEFQECAWTDFYPDAIEPIPDNMPQARGPNVRLSCFVDADHAGNLLTRRSHTGFVIYMNNSPIVWYSKRQNTVESSTFGSEMNALRIAVDQIQALRYKLRMMGIRCEIPADVYCDNQSVTKSVSQPEVTLSKKHNAICYHRIREAVAMGMIRIAWIDGKDNIADFFTKPLTVERRQHLLGNLLY